MGGNWPSWEGTEVFSDWRGCRSGSPWGGVGLEPQHTQRHVCLRASMACVSTGQLLPWQLYSHSVKPSLWHPKFWDTLGTCPRSSPLVKVRLLPVAHAPAPRVAPMLAPATGGRVLDSKGKAKCKKGASLGVGKDGGVGETTVYVK